MAATPNFWTSSVASSRHAAEPKMPTERVAYTVALTGFVVSLDADLGDTGLRRLDYQFRTPQGAVLDMGLTAMHLVTPSGPSGFLFNFQDVTKVRKLERDARIQHRLAAVGDGKSNDVPGDVILGGNAFFKFDRLAFALVE